MSIPLIGPATAEEAANDFVELLQKKDYGAAYNYFEPMESQLMSKENFVATRKVLAENGIDIAKFTLAEKDRTYAEQDPGNGKPPGEDQVIAAEFLVTYKNSGGREDNLMFYTRKNICPAIVATGDTDHRYLAGEVSE